VSGCGKSTLATNIAKALRIPVKDGDELHPKSNVEKMSQGIPLDDSDREPWLALIRKTAETICKELEEQGATDGDRSKGVVVACSSLKKYYRDILRGRHPASHAPPPVEDLPPNPPLSNDEKAEVLAEPAHPLLRTFFVYIHGTPKLLHERMAARQGHFMKVGMLQSQLATLEDPRGEEGVVTVKLQDSPETQVKDALEGLKVAGFGPGRAVEES
jgi:gluconokinase